jgi:beta-lactam-binding protein with PASTA domain
MASNRLCGRFAVTMTITGGAPPLKPQAAATPVVVPNVVGMSEYRAVVALDKAGLKINPAKYVSTAKQDLRGVVVEQSVKAGTKTTEPITITVGRK